jgi:hypothetical protein
MSKGLRRWPLVRELVGGAYGRDQQAMSGVNGFTAVDASLPMDLKACTIVAPHASFLITMAAFRRGRR